MTSQPSFCIIFCKEPLMSQWAWDFVCKQKYVACSRPDVSAVSAMASAIWYLAFFSYSSNFLRRPAGQTNIDTSTAKHIALCVSFEMIRPVFPKSAAATPAIKKDISPHSPQAQARIQKWSESRGWARAPIANFATDTVHSIQALVRDFVFMHSIGISNPIVAAKNKRINHAYTLLTWRSHVACTT